MVVADDVLEDAPSRNEDGRVRVKTPDRKKATKREGRKDREPDAVRRRLEVDTDDAVPLSPEAPPAMSTGHSPLQAWLRDGVETPKGDEMRVDFDGLPDVDVGSPEYAPTSPAMSTEQDGPSNDAMIDSIFDALNEEDKKIVASVIRGVDVTEIYSPARVNKLAAKMGLVPGHSLDLTSGWDSAWRSTERKPGIS